MKKEITLNAVQVASEEVIRQVLDMFEEQRGIHVNLQMIPWENYRQSFTNIALHRQPGDVAVAGTPTTSDLIAMNALRPFTSNEILTMGGETAFLPSRWQSTRRPDSTDAWAVPWILDIRVLYYRKDCLARAGVTETAAETAAFSSPQNFAETLERFQQCGVEVPWFALADHYGVLHRVSSWIWSNGGDLFSPDGKRAIFHEAEGLAGMRAYFSLLKYMPAGAASQNMRALLLEGKCGAMVDQAFTLFNEVPPEVRCAPLLGCSYVGGSDLLVWAHTRSEEASLELVRYLTQASVSAQISQETGYMPMRVSELNKLAAHANPNFRALAQAAFTGRTFPCVPLIGLVEDRLSLTLLGIQQEIMANPQADIDALLRQRIVPLGNRTNISLSSLY